LVTPIIEDKGTYHEFKDEDKLLLKYLDLKWEGISGFGKSTLVKSFSLWFLLVPFLVKFFDSIPDTITVLLFKETFTFALTSPLPNQIYYFYFAACFFTIGNFIYIWKCPEIIKIYTGYSDFKEKDGSSEKIVASIEYFGSHNDVSEKNAEAITFDFISKYCNETEKTKALEKKMWREQLNYCVITDKEIPNVFSYARSASNYLDRNIRQICTASYYLGGLIILFLLAQNFWVVTSAFSGNL